MRARTVTVSRDGADTWDVAPAVDATGWLARGWSAAGPPPGSPSGASSGSSPGAPTGSPSASSCPAESDRLAPSRRAVRRRIESARGPGTATVGVSPGVPPALACEPADDPVGYRLGRWARLALTLTVLATVVVVAVALWPAAGAQRMVDVTVGPGDTLWGIASDIAPDRDPRAVIAEIEELNGLGSTTLPIGVVLRVPASG